MDSPFKYRAFLSDEGTDKLRILSVVLRDLRREGKQNQVFYDDYVKRGGSRDDDLETVIKTGLRESEYLIVFLTPEFLRKKWPLLELVWFLEMMENDPRKKLLPVFLRVSAYEYERWAKEDVLKPPTCFNLQDAFGKRAELNRIADMLLKVKQIIGIDAMGRITDAHVVDRILADVFGGYCSANRLNHPSSSHVRLQRETLGAAKKLDQRVLSSKNPLLASKVRERRD
eukprot:Plantae.Rhodophyta-Hildenbrandia_rubra.ctg19086.p1 GENE.Plantae.Rhodophyta-Hildenbrandia_rubra.ctg19086~~Plantae.Rhodophyta-Hildenbrandia_rubra.ctg19086.p1  ORF type:complete len:228 (-),score=31.67 Plantae.Rhodophyta-Hildenbrandia_rubra.ctg19086:1580-2263(-)